ncbi:MAG: hypothetical protein J6A04_01620 [Clostridia bacterium]|nr:hypothetical protein [Clostridia bacterium]
MKVIVGKTNGNSKEVIEEIKNIAEKVELILVVGDKKSVEVNQMYQISLKECGNAMIIETMGDLYLNYIRRFRTVGVIQDIPVSQNRIDTIVDVLENTQVEGYIYEHFK